MISVLELCFMAFIGEVEPRQKLSLCQTIHGGSQASNSQELFLPYWLTNILYLVSGLTCFGFPFFLHFLAKQLWDCWGVLYNWQFPIFIFFSLQVHWSHCKYIYNITITYTYMLLSIVELSCYTSHEKVFSHQYFLRHPTWRDNERL